MNSPHADHARERAEKMQAEFDAAYSPDSPQAWRNKRLIILIVIALLASLLFCGLLTGYRVAGWFGLIAFAAIWFAPSAALMAWAIRNAPEIP